MSRYDIYIDDKFAFSTDAKRISALVPELQKHFKTEQDLLWFDSGIDSVRNLDDPDLSLSRNDVETFWIEGEEETTYNVDVKKHFKLKPRGGRYNIYIDNVFAFSSNAQTTEILETEIKFYLKTDKSILVEKEYVMHSYRIEHVEYNDLPIFIISGIPDKVYKLAIRKVEDDLSSEDSD